MRLATVQRGDATVAARVHGETLTPILGYADVGALLADGERGLAAARESAAPAEPIDRATLRQGLQAEVQAHVCGGDLGEQRVVAAQQLVGITVESPDRGVHLRPPAGLRGCGRQPPSCGRTRRLG